jgi:cell division protein FtsN
MRGRIRPYYISIFISILALLLAVIANRRISNMQSANESEFSTVAEKKPFQQIEKVPDVEVIKPDGTVIKAKSIESHDNLDKIVSKEVETTKASEVSEAERAKREKQSEKVNTPVVVARPAETPKAQTQEVKKSEPQGINGAFVIQAGSFKSKSLAETQCKKILAKVNFSDKKCGIAHGNGSYRSIIYPFKNNNEASAFANKVQKSTKISCLVKRNASR